MKIDTANGPIKTGLFRRDDFTQEIADRFEQIKKRCSQHTENGSKCDCPCCFLLAEIQHEKQRHIFHNVLIKLRTLPNNEETAINPMLRITEIGLAVITINGYAIIPREEYDALIDEDRIIASWISASKEARAHDSLSRSTDEPS